MQSLLAPRRKGCHKIHALAGLGKLEEGCKVVEIINNQDFQLLKEVHTLLPLNGAVRSSQIILPKVCFERISDFSITSFSSSYYYFSLLLPILFFHEKVS